MKILIPAWSFYPSQEGGPSNALYWLASGLAKAGYEVRVVATNRYLPSGFVLENMWTRLNGFDVIYGSVKHHYNRIKNEIRNCDLLIANGVCSIKNYKLNQLALSLGKRVILSPRGELFDSAIFHKGKVNGLLKCLVFSMMKRTYGKRVLFHATSPEEEVSIKKYMGINAQIAYIPNYMILPDKVKADSSIGPYLLYVGRLNHIKNIHIILSGLAESSAFMESNVIFKLAGEMIGEYYEALVSQVKELKLTEKVEFLGLVTGEKKDKLYAGAKCLLLMSKSENFGNVIVEALSQGTPVIASKGTPWPQLGIRGAGWWIEAEPRQVAAAVDTLLSLNDDAYQGMRESSFALSREFDIFANIYKWKEVINH